MVGTTDGDCDDVHGEIGASSKVDEQTVSYNRCVVGTTSLLLPLLMLALGAGLVTCALHWVIYTRTMQIVSYNRCVVGTASLLLPLLKLALGAGLVTCAMHGIIFTRDDKDGFGLPYYIGGFVAGPLLLIGTLIDCCVHRKSRTVDVESQTGRAELRAAIVPQSACACLTIVVSTFCVPFVAIFGMRTCDPEAELSSCPYTINMDKNKNLATMILIGLLLTIALEVSTMYFVCCSGMLQGLREASARDGKPFISKRRGRMAKVRIEYVDRTGGIGGGEQQSMIVHDAARSRGTTVIEVPAKASAIPTAADAVNAEPGEKKGVRVKGLEEENRLLREQLELRQQLNQQQQQQQQQFYPPPPAPMQPGVPPPSYGAVVSE